MADILLFHHIQGLTGGVRAFADELRAAGHSVTAPDLFGGRTFPTIEAGEAHARRLGFDAIVDTGVAAARDLPNELVYGGFSMGAMPAQRLVQQRPGARGALLYHGAVPLGHYGDAWPDGVPLQMHAMRDDPWEDAATLEAFAREADGELFLYDGDAHLFTDRSLEAYDPEAAALVLERTLAFLAAPRETPSTHER